MHLESGKLQAAYLIADQDATKVTARLIIPFGEMDNPYTQGLLHFVEHLAWLNSMGQNNSDFGRDTNASTTIANLTYWVAVDAPTLTKNLRTLNKVFEPITLENDFMLEERSIVGQEYTLRVTESTWYEHNRNVVQALFAPHPISRSVLGQLADIETFSLQDALDLHRQSHKPDQAVLLIYGNTTQEIAQKAVDDAFAGSNPHAPIMARQYAFTEDARDQKVVSVSRLEGQEIDYNKVFHLKSPIPYHRLLHIKSLLDRIFVSTYEGGFARPLRYENFIAKTFEAYISILDTDDLRFSFNAAPDSDVSLKELLAEFETQLALIAQNGISQQTFDKVKEQYIAGLQNVERPAAVIFGNAVYDIEFRQKPIGYAEDLDIAKSITRTEINTLLRQIVGQGHVVIRLINQPTGEE